MESLYLPVSFKRFFFHIPNGIILIQNIFFSDSPYTRAVSAGVLSLQEKGILQKLKTKWWKEMHGGGNCVVSQIIKKKSVSHPAAKSIFRQKIFLP